MPSFEHQVRFAATPRVMCVVNQSAVEQLSPSLKQELSNAPIGLLIGMNLLLGGSEREMYLFSSEKSYYRGLAELRKSKYGTVDFAVLTSSPAVLAAAAEKHRPSRLVLDVGAEGAVEISEKELLEFGQIATVTRLAALDKLYIVEGEDGFALPTELEDGEYAVGYLNEEQGELGLRRLGDGAGGCGLGPNPPKQLAASILGSPFKGLILNPGMSAETILRHDDLELLVRAHDVLHGRGVLGLGRIKGLFGLHRAPQ